LIKIQWLGMTATLEAGGIWKASDKQFTRSLNVRAGQDSLGPGYYPNLEAALLDLVKKEFPGLEVLEPPRAQKPAPEEADY